MITLPLTFQEEESCVEGTQVVGNVKLIVLMVMFHQFMEAEAFAPMEPGMWTYRILNVLLALCSLLVEQMGMEWAMEKVKFIVEIIFSLSFQVCQHQQFSPMIRVSLVKY